MLKFHPKDSVVVTVVRLVSPTIAKIPFDIVEQTGKCIYIYIHLYGATYLLLERLRISSYCFTTLEALCKFKRFYLLAYLFIELMRIAKVCYYMCYYASIGITFDESLKNGDCFEFESCGKISTIVKSICCTI